MQTASFKADRWLEVSVHRKVLRPANSIKCFRDLPRPSTGYRTGTKHPQCTTGLSHSPSNNNSTIHTHNYPSTIYQNVVMQHSKHKFNRIPHSALKFKSLHLLNPLPLHFPSHLPYFRTPQIASILPVASVCFPCWGSSL
jgi:hypothetical protein